MTTLAMVWPELKDAEQNIKTAAEAAAAGDSAGAVQAAEIAEAWATAQQKVSLVAIALAIAIAITLAIKKKAMPKILRWVQHPAVVVPALGAGVIGGYLWYSRRSTADAWTDTAQKMLAAQKAGQQAVADTTGGT